MDGKINRDGFIEVKRGFKYKKQMCMSCTEEIEYNCGDYCLWFREPEEFTSISGKKTLIKLCKIDVYFKDFIDERVL